MSSKCEKFSIEMRVFEEIWYWNEREFLIQFLYPEITQ